MRTNDEDSKDHEESSRNHNDKDTPPPDHHFLLLPEKCPEKEQKREFDADNGSSNERRDSIHEVLGIYEPRNEVWRRTCQTRLHVFRPIEVWYIDVDCHSSCQESNYSEQEEAIVDSEAMRLVRSGADDCSANCYDKCDAEEDTYGSLRSCESGS